MRFARQHPYYGWLFLEPDDYRKVYNQLIQMRDQDLKNGDNSSGFPSGFPDWCKTHLEELSKQEKYKKRIAAHLEQLQLSTTVVTNLSPLIISFLANYSITGSYRIFQLLFNAFSSALLGYYIHLWVDSNNLKSLDPVENVIKKLSRLFSVPIIISFFYSFLVSYLFTTQINSPKYIIFTYGVISSISFIYGSFATIYSLFLNGTGFPLYTCKSTIFSSLIFIISAALISKFGFYELVPFSFLLANISCYLIIRFYSFKANKLLNNN